MRALFFAFLLFLLAAGSLLAADIAPDDAKNHVGEAVTVRGTVAEVFFSKGGNAYLKFGSPFPNQIFSAAMLAKRTPELLAGDHQWLKDMEGKVVAVSGKVELYKVQA